MKKVEEYVNGKRVIKYTFTAKEKELLSGEIPFEPCLYCSADIRSGCCGCGSYKEYSRMMVSKFGEDRELLDIARKIAHLRLRKIIINNSLAEWEEDCSTLPKQVREFAKRV